MLSRPAQITTFDGRRQEAPITRHRLNPISRLHVSGSRPVAKVPVILLTRANSAFLLSATAASRPPRLPPLLSTEMSPEQYYPPSAGSQLSAPFGYDGRSPRSASISGGSQPQQQQHPTPGRGPVPKFQKVKSIHDLQPRINAQPPYRRANPEGGFISVSHPPNFISLVPSNDRI